MSTDYEKFYQENPNGLGEPTKEFVDFFNKLNEPGLSVLDVGCGQGRDALFISRLGYGVTAVDISPTGIAQLESDAKKEKLNINAVAADIRIFTPDKEYDVLLIDRTLHMLVPEEQIEVLRNLLKYLADNGVVLIADEKKNIPAFKKVLEETELTWEPILEKGGYLFVAKK